MTDYFYDMDLVVDPLNPSNVVANGLVSIYDPADTAGVTLLALKDPSGLPLPNPLPSNANGFLPPRIATVPQTMWKSGGFTGYFNSYKGLRDESVAAVTAAQSAANDASTAAAQVVTTAAVDGNGALVLTKASGATVNAGNVKGAKGDKGDKGDKGLDGSNVLPTDDAIKQAINDTASATRGALNATYATPAGVANLIKPFAARLPGNRAVFLGDSNTFGYNQSGENYPDAACLYSAGNLIKVKNAGVSGQTISQIAARVQADVIDQGANICFVMAGTNDLSSDTVDLEPLKTMYRRDIIEKMQNAGVTPVLCSILPGNWSTARKSKIVQFNLWINRQAQSLGVPYVDFYREMADPATGDWLAQWSPTVADAYHPNAAAYRRMGKIAYDTVVAWLPPAPAQLVANNIETTNKHYNGCFIIDSNADSMPDGNVAIGTSAGLNYALEDAAGYAGKAWRLTITNGTGDLTRGIQSPSPSHVAGNRIAIACKVDINSADLPAGCGFIMDLAWNNGTTETVFKTGAQVKGGVAYVEAVVPAGATAVDVRRYFKVAANRADTFKLGQITVRDLTALNTLN